MPTYTYYCKKCNHEEDHIFPMRGTPDRLVHIGCGETMRRIFKAPQVHVRQPYVTSNITGEPVEIRSARQEEDLCNRHGVARIMDGESSVVKKKPNKMPHIAETYQKLGAISVNSA